MGPWAVPPLPPSTAPGQCRLVRQLPIRHLHSLRRSPSPQAKTIGRASTRPSTSSAWLTKWTSLPAPALSTLSSVAPTFRMCCQRPRPIFTASLVANSDMIANWPTLATHAACASSSTIQKPLHCGDDSAWERSVCYHVAEKSGIEFARDPRRARRALRLQPGWLGDRQRLLVRPRAAFTTSLPRNARLRIDACIKS